MLKIRDRRRPSTTAPAAATVAVPRSNRGGVIAVLLAVTWLIIAAVIHLTQGTADLDLPTLWSALVEDDLSQAQAVLLESRVPRLMAALLVGGALGMAGAAMQVVTRNPLASPDTSSVGAGAYLALTLTAVFGAALGPLPGIAVAFVGGVAAAALVIGLSSGGVQSPTRLVLAGSVLTLGLGSVTSALLIFFQWETQGLFAWGAGSLSQNGSTVTKAAAPVMAVAAVVLVVLGRSLDLLQLGDDTAAGLGVNVARTRWLTIGMAVLLTSVAVTVAGPIGFVGLCAPAILRLLIPVLPALRKSRVFLLVSILSGAALILTSDVLLRAIFGGNAGITIPIGVFTSLIGAFFIVVLARKLPSGRGDDSIATMRLGNGWGRKRPGTVISAWSAVLITVVIAGVLIGDSTVLLGDVANRLRGVGAPRINIILDSRVPRVFAALLAGGALALAGALVQAVARNPLADPGILGVSAMAGFGAIFAITVMNRAPDTVVFFAAVLGASVAAVILIALSRSDQMRMILIGIGLGAAASAGTTMLIVATDPWNQTKAITWLGGSTYGATVNVLIPLLIVLTIGLVVTSLIHRDLDVLQLDDTTPRVLGVDVPRVRMICVAVAVGLTAAATAGIGVIAFVGLVAPHAARMLVGKRHAVMIPLAVILGSVLVVIADLVGRSLIAPGQVPAGMVVALIGTPYFLMLLRRMRVTT